MLINFGTKYMVVVNACFLLRKEYTVLFDLVVPKINLQYDMWWV